MTTEGAVAVEVDAVGGAIWLKSTQMAPLTGYMRVYACKNDSPGVVRTYVDAAGCKKEFFWAIWVTGDAELTRGS
jgi:hypothetical protein